MGCQGFAGTENGARGLGVTCGARASELRCVVVAVQIEKIAVLSVRHDSLWCCGVASSKYLIGSRSLSLSSFLMILMVWVSFGCAPLSGEFSPIGRSEGEVLGTYLGHVWGPAVWPIM